MNKIDLNLINFNGDSSGEGGGGGEPSQYIKNASKSPDGNTLTLTKKNGTQVVFSPQSGGNVDFEEELVTGDIPEIHVFADAPSDSEIYGRSNGEWKKMQSTDWELIDTITIPEPVAYFEMTLPKAYKELFFFFSGIAFVDESGTPKDSYLNFHPNGYNTRNECNLAFAKTTAANREEYAHVFLVGNKFQVAHALQAYYPTVGPQNLSSHAAGTYVPFDAYTSIHLQPQLAGALINAGYKIQIYGR